MIVILNKIYTIFGWTKCTIDAMIDMFLLRLDFMGIKWGFMFNLLFLLLHIIMDVLMIINMKINKLMANIYLMGIILIIKNGIGSNIVYMARFMCWMRMQRVIFIMKYPSRVWQMMLFRMNTINTVLVGDVFVIIFDQINELVAKFILMECVVVSIIVMMLAFGWLCFI